METIEFLPNFEVIERLTMRHPSAAIARETGINLITPISCRDGISIIPDQSMQAAHPL
jgi:hypothetical protein